MVDKKSPWTDAEKVRKHDCHVRSQYSHADASIPQASVLFQLIPSAIPWNTITLPKGRTLKAVQIMISKEKEKLKRARDDVGEDSVEDGEGGDAAKKAAAAKAQKRQASETSDEETDFKMPKGSKIQRIQVKEEPEIEEPFEAV
nr:hypothetical protein CFP56_70542 [Quercus suber]